MLTINFLKRAGKNFIWPQKSDMQVLPLEGILCTLEVEPRAVSKSRPGLLSLPAKIQDYVASLFEQP